MSEPPSKKLKMSDGTSPKPAIVFKTPGTKPDICFSVFGQEFHVSSLALKLNSGFFRTFLEPSGGKQPMSTRKEFTSQWFTKVDEDGTWALTSDHDFSKDDLSKFKGDIQHEKAVFQKLLSALFGRQYHIETVAELKALSEMASYYNALQALSFSLDVSMLNNLKPSFVEEMIRDPCTVLACARMLRNKVLFKDSLLLSLGPLTAPQYLVLDVDTELRKVAAQAHGKLGILAANTHRDILLTIYSMRRDGIVSAKNDVNKQLTELLEYQSCLVKVSRQESTRWELRMPQYYRQCLSLSLTPTTLRNQIQSTIKALLSNELILASTAVAGEGEFVDHYLCLKIDDEDLPWDLTQEDW